MLSDWRGVSLFVKDEDHKHIRGSFAECICQFEWDDKKEHYMLKSLNQDIEGPYGHLIEGKEWFMFKIGDYFLWPLCLETWISEGQEAINKLDDDTKE